MDEKFDILESNSRDIRIIYIVDAQNGGVSGQYPESLMKIQTRQGYCLYLSIESIDYYKAELKAVFFIQDIDGLWQEFSFAADKLSKFEIDDKGRLIHEGRQLEELIKEAMVRFVKEQETLKLKRKEAAERAGRLKQFLAKEEWEQEERRKQSEDRQKEWERQQAEAERRRREWAEKQRIEQEKKEQEKCERNAAFQAILEKDFTEIQEA